jgi:hypothetical protein
VDLTAKVHRAAEARCSIVGELSKAIGQ